MKHRQLWQALIALVLFSVSAVIAPSAGQGTRDMELPQFHGQRRDNLSNDKDLLRRWPDGGPKLIWKAEGIGHGFSIELLMT